MSAQFGRWNHDGAPVDVGYLQKAAAVISPYGPDGESSYTKHNIAIVYHAFHITKESRRETQPYMTASGAIITWDGRLDNRAELIGTLGKLLTADSTDLSIVAAAYDQWGTDCFSRLIGDWSLSICNPSKRLLVLAKDPIGTRQLYYSFDRNYVSWSTILDPLALFAGKSLQLDEEYIAGWLSFFPAAHLTPYAEIRSVPPSCFVLLRPGSCLIKKYWDFDPGKRTVYSTDGEYEEHFRAVFSQAVRRRLRSDSPILAELSGGIDSSSIVCMADEIIGRGEAATPRLDTLSFYDDSEPNWNERPYFTKVEQKRGRTGCHIDIGNQELFECELRSDGFVATPGSSGGHPNQVSRQFAACLVSAGHRVVLSGTGGDEVMGGVPTPTPELEDLLASGDLTTLTHQLKTWALNKRKPWFHLLFEAARGFFPPALVGVPKHRRPAPWLNQGFVRQNRAALQGYQKRLKLFGPLPTFQENLATLDALRRQLACDGLSPEPLYLKYYPYLDRDLLQFMYSIPREQVIRPNQRRSLMRRALAGIVPDELLSRKRKAYVVRSPMAAISEQWTKLVGTKRQIVSSGIVDPHRLDSALRSVRDGKEIPVVLLFRTLHLESWLRAFERWRTTEPAGPKFFGRTAGCETNTIATAEGKVTVVKRNAMKYEQPSCYSSGCPLNDIQSAEKCACLWLDSIGEYAASTNGYDADE